MAEGQSLAVEIAETVAGEVGRDPTSLPPLHDYVDTDALNSLFESTKTSDRRQGRIEFTYDEHVVTVTFDGDYEISVDEKSEPDVQTVGDSSR